jgi:hypothetical protein
MMASKSDQQQGLARDDARNEYDESGSVAEAAAAANGEGHAAADADAEYQSPDMRARSLSCLFEWYSCAPPAAKIARLRLLLACHSSITRPSCDNKRQRSPHETMRPLGACRSRR